MTAFELRKHLQSHHTMVISGRDHATLEVVHRRDHELRPIIEFAIVHNHNDD